jgi:tetratricopeptide (TPR) repeat protein
MRKSRPSLSERAERLPTGAWPRIGKHVALGLAMIAAVAGILAGVYYWPHPAAEGEAAANQTPFPPLELPDEPDPIAIEPLRAEAETMVAQLLARFPDSPAAHRAAATLYQYFIQYDTAIEHWRRCVELEPRSVSPRVWLAQAQLKQGQDAAAIETLREAEAAGLSSPELALQIATALQQTGQLPAAEKAALDGLQAFGDQFSLWVSAGQAQLQLGKIPDAKQSFGKAVELDPGAAAAHVGLASALARLGETETAAGHQQAAERLIEKQKTTKLPFDKEYDHGLRHVVATVMADAAAEYDAAGDAHEAERLCRRGMQIVPASPDPYRRLANLYHRQGRLDEAWLVQQRLTTLEPENLQNFLNQANLALRLQRPSEAEAALIEAVKRAPRDPAMRQSLAVFYLEAGKSPLARPHAEELVQLAPSPAAYQLLAEVCRQQGDREALDAAEQLLRQWQDSARPAPQLP